METTNDKETKQHVKTNKHRKMQNQNGKRKITQK